MKISTLKTYRCNTYGCKYLLFIEFVVFMENL